MLEQIVLSQGISTDKQSGLTCRILSECGCSGIQHPSESVRKVAERVLILVYKINPRLIRKQLPPDDDITRRNLLYRQLFTEFDKIDTQKKVVKSVTVGSNKDRVPSATRLQSENMPMKCSRKEEQINHNSKINKILLKCSRINSNQSDSTGSETDSHSCDKSLKRHIKKSINKLNCPFCDWICDGTSLLDKHFWKCCPILTKCPACAQILEVADLTHHITGKFSILICLQYRQRLQPIILKSRKAYRFEIVVQI